MRKTLTAIAVALTMLVVAVASPRQADARNGRVAGAIIGGFAAGAIIGSMVNRGYYYGPGPGYYYGPGYYPGPVYVAPPYYGPVYEYGPYYYARPRYYEAPPVYVRPVPRYRRGGCWIETDSVRGYGYWGPCY